MKKLLIAMALSALMLSGCGMFRSQKAWEKAQQETPLEIPPGLDHPSASAALVIPPPPQGQAQDATAAAPAPAATQDATSLQLADDVETAYRRVGQALERGDLGTVSAQDDAAHTFQLDVRSQSVAGQEQGFFQKHFSNAQQEDKPDALAAGGAVATVIVKVAAGANGGSTISAQGDPQQAARVISVLKGRLGG